MDRVVHRSWFLIVWPILLAIVAAVIALLIANSNADAKFKAPSKGANAAGVVDLWKIQPGLGTVMIEYAQRFDELWWSVDGGNWDMAAYQLKEMPEIQEVAETTRPSRADALKKFENDDLNKLVTDVKNKDKTAFTTDYDNAINACNKCHGEQKGSGTQDNTFKFVQIIRPTSQAPYSNVQLKSGQ
jgi:hypothetical protein